MTGVSGGVGSAFGFRYQYLVTVELLLTLYSTEGTDWVVEVDPVGQDSADIVFRSAPGKPPKRVIQVKASMQESSTTIGVPLVTRTLAGMRQEHPKARHFEIVTNRLCTKQLAEELAKPESTVCKDGESIVQRTESTLQLTKNLLSIIRNLRAEGAGATGTALHYVLLRQLVDSVHEAASRPHDQSMDYEDVRAIMEGSASLLSRALGERGWGKCIQVPTGDFIDRQESSGFLREHLPIAAIYEGKPRIAILNGLSGTGKSVAACLYVRSLQEHVAFVLWLDASSTETLNSQVPLVLNELGVPTSLSDQPVRDLMEILSELPVPWVLVLDGASSLEEIEPWVPRSGYGQVVVTTLAANWPSSFAPTLTMDAFSECEAHQFIARRLAQVVKSWSSEERSACNKITQSLAGWPLAMEIAISWIARHGGSLTAMKQFSERIDRLDLNDKALLPHGYPQGAANAILSQWQELTTGAQLLASFVLIMGGRRVPSHFLIDAFPFKENGRAAFEELLNSGLVRQEIVTSESPHDLDEMVSVHGFLQLVIDKNEFSLAGEHVLTLINASDNWVRNLTDNGRFREGAALIGPIDHLLKRTVQWFEECPEVLVFLSASMHNLAQLALVTSQAATAREWSRLAVRVRQVHADLVPHHVKWAEIQLQTLAIAAVTAARLHYVEEVNEAGSLTISFLQQTDGSAANDQLTRQALCVLRDVLHLSLSDSSHRCVHEAVQQLNTLVPQKTSELVLSGAGNALLKRLQLEEANAILLVEGGAWRGGVDIALGVANQALEQGALVDHMVDGLLDVGLLLLIEAIKRPLNTPRLLTVSVNRLVVWLEENSALLDSSQQCRHLVLSAFVQDAPGVFLETTQSFPPEVERTPQLDTWADLAMMLHDRQGAMRNRKMFSTLPPSFSIVHSTDGGTHLNVGWQCAEQSAPQLWVHAPEIIAVSSSGQTDPVREGMQSAGLPEIAHDEAPSLIRGWIARLSDQGINISDAEGKTWVSIEDVPEHIAKRISAHGGLVLLYGDLPSMRPTDSRLCGWIPFETESKQSRREPEGRSTWWRRLFRWSP